MTTQQATPRRTTSRIGGVLALTVAGVVTVAVAAVGVATWQGARPGAGADVNGRATGHTAESAAPIAGRTTPSAVPSRAAAPIIYLVASREQAGVLRAAILAEEAALGAAHGQPSPTTQVMWFDSVEAEASFWWAMDEQARAALGLNPVTVVDLRAPVPATPATDAPARDVGPAAFSDQEMYLRWRQAQAAPVPETVSHPDWE